MQQEKDVEEGLISSVHGEETVVTAALGARLCGDGCGQAFL